MGVENRVWMQEGRPPADGPARTAAILALTLLGVWIVYLAVTPGTRTAPSDTGRFISEELLLRPAQVLDGAWWQLLTAPLFHSVRGVFHPLMLLFLLYVIGRWVEARGGRRRYLRVVLLGVLVWDGVLLCFARDTRLVALGMEGPVFALLGWTAVHASPADSLSLGGSNPRLDHLVLVALVVVGLMLAVAQPGGSASSPFPFLCAYLVSFGAGQVLGRLDRRGAGEAKPITKKRPRKKAHPLEVDVVDRLLDKVGREGISSLTPAERETLERASRERR